MTRGGARLQNSDRLHNHWDRANRGRAYYWYMTFESAPAMHALAEQCRDVLRFPYYDFTPPRDLHMTLDRIGFERDLSVDQLRDRDGRGGTMP